MLILMDGLDEVRNQDINPVLHALRTFVDQYYRNRYVVSCRTGANKLTLRGFTDVEIAPFSAAQITAFVQKWFVALGRFAPSIGQAKDDELIEKLKCPENWPFCQLLVTPLFLHLACWVFQGKGQFPSKRTAFYKQGIDLLLGKWDEAKGIERDDIYRDFFLPQKMKFLSQIAAVTLEKGQYFFEQRTIEQYIEDYLQNLSDTVLDPEELSLESEVILKAIEVQHGLLIERARGIFSFSYLAFQEYLTARKIVTNHDHFFLEQALKDLVSHLTDPHWREVFLLTAAMLRNADSLVQLMKQEIDSLVAQDPHLQDFLWWASQKFQTLDSTPKLATTHAFYLALAQSPHTTDQIQPWWQENYVTWVNQLRTTIIHYRDIHHPWQLSAEQQQSLKRYYEANQLLVDCLNSACEVTETIRQEIESALLRPQRDMED